MVVAVIDLLYALFIVYGVAYHLLWKDRTDALDVETFEACVYPGGRDHE